jgi:hypothetical protein
MNDSTLERRKTMTITTKARPYVNRAAEHGAVTVDAYVITWNPLPSYSADSTPIIQRFSRDSLDEQLERCYALRSYTGIDVIFNHGDGPDGAPAEVFARPLGEIVSLHTDDHGLRSTVAYGRSVLAERVLSMIGSGEVLAQSARLHVLEETPTSPAPYDVVTVHKAMLREFGPNLSPHDPDARLVSLGGVELQHRSTAWVEELERLLTGAEQSGERARSLSRDIDLMVAWETRTCRQHPFRRDPAPQLANPGMTSGQRWAARSDAEREAQQLHRAARDLLASHGFAGPR